MNTTIHMHLQQVWILRFGTVHDSRSLSNATNSIWVNVMVDFINIHSVCPAAWWYHPLFIILNICAPEELNLLRLHSWLTKNLSKQEFKKRLQPCSSNPSCIVKRAIKNLLEISTGSPGMLWSYVMNLTYKGDVPVWLLQTVVFCIINWKFCFCFRHFDPKSPWALDIGLTRQIFSRPVFISFPCILLVQLLLFLIFCCFLFAEILFPDIFSFYHLILKNKQTTTVKPVLCPLVQSDF